MQKTFDEVFTYEHLIESMKKCRKGVGWKGTVQFYENTAITNTTKTYLSLKKRNIKTGDFFHFDIMERGKPRHIQSVRIDERVVQRCFCDYFLVPELSKRFIYDNSACVKGKGMHFAIKRLKRHLHNYYIKYGNNKGYILQFDFSKYFESIPHQQLIDMVNKIIIDKDLQNLFAQLVNDFGGDKGLGLGSQISQISALYYPHKIDETFANDKNIFAYARYMDDGYIICESKQYLQKCLSIFNDICKELNISPNQKKTHILKMTTTMEYLKARVKMHENGKIVIKPNRKNITRNRLKLKKLKKLLLNGMTTLYNITMIYRTTCGNFKFFNAYNTKHNYELLFKELFKKGGKNNEVYCL